MWSQPGLCDANSIVSRQLAGMRPKGAQLIFDTADVLRKNAQFVGLARVDLHVTNQDATKQQPPTAGRFRSLPFQMQGDGREEARWV